MSRMHRFTMALAVLLVATPLAAQGTQGTQGTPETLLNTPAPNAVAPVAAPAHPSAGPTEANAAVGIRAIVSTAAPAPLAPQGSVGRNPAMMIVGAAAFIIGAFLQDPARPIVMVAGAGLGIYGLWQYLK